MGIAGPFADDRALLAALLRSLTVLVEDGSLSLPEPGDGGADPLDAWDLPVDRSGVCPSCGAEALGTAQVVPDVALGRVVGIRFEAAGETEIDWSDARTLRRRGGTVLVCAGCGARWIHPALIVP